MDNADAIARLVAALEAGPTPGPWEARGLSIQFAESWKIKDASGYNGPPHTIAYVVQFHRRGQILEDTATFIAACRAGVPALLARVRELEDALSALVGACAEDHWPVKAQHMTPLAQARSALAASGTGGKP